MKTLFIECRMGAAGDMLTAALLELFPEPEKIIAEMNSFGIPEVEYIPEEAEKCGIKGTHMRVLVHGEEEDEHMHDHHHHDHEHDLEHEHHHHHHHAHPADIEALIDTLHVNDAVKADAKAVYALIAEAESHAHGKPVDEIHYHEVGTKDAVADVTAVCWLINKLAPEQIVVSPVHVGSGTVHCAHGVLPVPAPATAHILRDVPIYSTEIRGELCTPTGAALLKHFADRFAEMPAMRTQAIGYGMGKKDFPAANCVRVFWGETGTAGDQTIELDFNVDDMTGEEIGYAVEKLLAGGAREVFTTPVYMKKNRPGILFSVLCTESTKEDIVKLIFRHTTTIGMRETKKDRYTLRREVVTEETALGQVRTKRSSGYGTEKEKLEFEDIARIADETGQSLFEVRKALK